MNKRKNFLVRIICCILTVAIVIFSTGCEMIYGFVPSLCPHEWNLIKTLQEPTCTEDGVGEYYCAICDSEKGDDISKTGHTFNNYSNNNLKHWKKCVNCTQTIEDANHTFINIEGKNKCSVCSYEHIDTSGQLEFHFMMLGNDYAGDAVYIKAGENDILIDAGSRKNSIDDIQNYLSNYVLDNKLEFVIVTHADQDHIAGFSKIDGSIFDIYNCETIIDFPLSDKTSALYLDYQLERQDEVEKGAKHYTALECYNNQNGAQRIYNLSSDGSIKMEILYNYYYENTSSDENNYSVCVMFHHGDRQFLFTGDLEEEGETKLAQQYDFNEVELFKAGHHGSPTSSNEVLLKEIKPKICVITCCAGSVEYTDYLPNTFPSRAVLDRIENYTDKIYIPIYIDIAIDESKPTTTFQGKTITNYKNADEFNLLNGNIVVISKPESEVYVDCSNNNTILEETTWYQNMRLLWQDAMYN